MKLSGASSRVRWTYDLSNISVLVITALMSVIEFSSRESCRLQISRDMIADNTSQGLLTTGNIKQIPRYDKCQDGGGEYVE